MTHLRGVLDANLLATAVRSRGGTGNRLLQAATVGRFELIVSSYLLAEVRRTLDGVFRIAAADLAAALEFVTAISTAIEPSSISRISRDPDDDPILALAAQSGAAFLAAYDHDLMAVGSVGACGIVHPTTAMQLVEGCTWPTEEGPGGVSVEDRPLMIAYARRPQKAPVPAGVPNPAGGV